MKTSIRIAVLNAFLLTLLATASPGQSLSEIDTRSDIFAEAMGFEVVSSDSLPTLWSSDGSVTLDREIVHSGNSAAKLVLDGPTSLTVDIPVDFAGTNVELRGFLRTESVTRAANPFVPGPPASALDPIEGTQDWTQFSVKTQLTSRAHTLTIGLNYLGQGTIWIDDLELLIDGQPIRDVPRITVEPDDQERSELIAKAVSAGIPRITDEATIKTVYGLEIKVLREGSNGWTCWAETQGLGPMCNEPEWDEWLMAYWNDEESLQTDRFSTSYMLAGENEPPHVMILAPNEETLSGLPTRGFNPIWAMWMDTPYRHIMLNVGEFSSMTQQQVLSRLQRRPSLMLPPAPYIPFEPVELSAAELERYAGTYENAELSLRLTVTADQGALLIQDEEALRRQRVVPASESRFISGAEEIIFQIDDEGTPVQLSSGPATFERIE